MAHVAEISVARLLQSKISRRYVFAFSPLKLSLFALAYLIAYVYGNFSQTAASPLWFPDSVLLCALLLTPINEWWVYLVIALPIRFIPTHHPAVPLWFVFATSANDLIKATLAAYLLRRLRNGSTHPSNMSQLATFLGVSVFFLPSLSAFAGAGARHLLGYGFWISWYQWFLGDALANAVLTPALLYWFSKQFRVLRPRGAELMVWIAGFLLSLLLALSLAHSAYSPIAVCIPVPFLIWAATRFGLIGASTSLSVIAFLATGRIAERGALFSMGFESRSLLFLQLFLFVVSIPVLSIATVMEEKNAVEKDLRESEQRLRLAQWAAHIGTFDLNMQTGVDIWQPETEALYGLRPGSFGRTLTAFEDLIHPDDRQRIMGLTQEMIKTGQDTDDEWRVVWPDGSVHWIAGRGRVLKDQSGKPLRMVGVNMDVTKRKQAEQALADLTRKLIEAQEQERARIGRELHDDINQRLAMLSVEIEQLREKPSDMNGLVHEFRRQIGELSSDVQALSHDLHSSKLEYLGAVAGIRSWCREFAERNKLEIDFGADVSSPLPRDLGISLFRVLQEALQNALKHSGVKRFEVHLREGTGEIRLEVRDSGKGFDVQTALQGKGLGLTSMRERIRLVNGTITIESKPMSGTIILVRVPFTQRATT